MCAYELAQANKVKKQFNVTIVDMGGCLASRQQNNHTSANVAFGCGGAGLNNDGKITLGAAGSGTHVLEHVKEARWATMKLLHEGIPRLTLDDLKKLMVADISQAENGWGHKNSFSITTTWAERQTLPN